MVGDMDGLCHLASLGVCGLFYCGVVSRRILTVVDINGDILVKAWS